MDTNTTPSPSNLTEADKAFIDGRALRVAYVVMAMGFILLFAVFAHAQELWPAPEIHGTQRDITHLPQLPFFSMDPTNLQHQMASQPGVGLIPSYTFLAPATWDAAIGMNNLGTTMHYDHNFGTNTYAKGSLELMKKIVDDYEKWMRAQ